MLYPQLILGRSVAGWETLTTQFGTILVEYQGLSDEASSCT